MEGAVELPDSSQHQNHGKNTQQGHVEEQHDPLGCPTMGDLGRYGAGPAHTMKEWIAEVEGI